jgi:prevent-host-death family protein
VEFTVHEAKTHFSKLVQQALAGEEVVITSGKARKPVVKLVAAATPSSTEPKKRPKLGWLKGQLPDIGPDHPFFDPLPEDELALWNGEGE